jgi:hypothetical protein
MRPLNEHWQKNETQQCQLKHASEANNTEQNQVSSSPFHMISICHFPLLWMEVCIFYETLCTFILNIYNHLIVLMIANGMKVLVVVKI